MEHQRSLDRLATVSRVFMDARLLTLRRQNEELRLELFWTVHNVQKLKIAMKEANASGSARAVQCNCWKCSLNGMVDGNNAQNIVDRNKTCKLIPWLEAKMTECDLIYDSMPGPHAHVDHMSDSSGRVCDVDCHFVEQSFMRGFMCNFTYGSKLWKARSVDNPELKKLEKFFQLINVEPTTDE